MTANRISALLGCLSFALLAYVLLDYYQSRNGPLAKRFERQWLADVEQLEASNKLPKAWFDVKEIELIPANPSARKLVRLIQVPLTAKAQGHYKLEILMVAWEEPQRTGVLLQYNLADLKTKNTVFELNRNLVLPRSPVASKTLATE